MGWYIALGALVLLIIWYIGTYNRLVSLKTRVEEGFSTIDVFLKKRYDLIPNLVATVKGYAAHERETLDAVISARAKAVSSAPEQRMENEAALTQALGRLLMISENYPDLKADSQFINLQRELTGIEGEIEKSRRYYNGVAAQLNMAVQKIPSSIVASMAGFTKVAFFEIESAVEREAVRVEF